MSWHHATPAVAVLLFAILLGDPLRAQQQASFSGQVVHVLDGDSLEISWCSQQVRVEVAGVDCPDRGRPYADDAAARTAQLVRLTPVRVTAMERRPDTLLVKLGLPGERDLAAELLSAGLACPVAAERVDLLPLVEEARAARRGVWSLPDACRSCTPRAACCRICEGGQACGNTCISRNYQCRKGSGCACDQEDLCS
jgi:micrococcal nuclease